MADVTHAARYQDLRASYEAEDMAKERALDVKYRWSERFLNESRLEADLGSMGRGPRTIHAARLGERWGMHPEIVGVMVAHLCSVQTTCFKTLDPDDTDEGRFPAAPSQWWV